MNILDYVQFNFYLSFLFCLLRFRKFLVDGLYTSSYNEVYSMGRVKMTKVLKTGAVHCKTEDHDVRSIVDEGYPDLAFEKAARLFRALGDESRLRLLRHLASREACVTEIAALTGEGLSTISQRLRILRGEGLVRRRRDGKHLFYSLVDNHIKEILNAGLEHSIE